MRLCDACKRGTASWCVEDWPEGKQPRKSYDLCTTCKASIAQAISFADDVAVKFKRAALATLLADGRRDVESGAEFFHAMTVE